LIWFASPRWEPGWDGHLNIFRDEECWKTTDTTKNPDMSKGVDKIEYVPNRAVLFPAHLAHIPETPSIKNVLRLSVGLHLSPAEKWEYIYIPRNNNG